MKGCLLSKRFLFVVQWNLVSSKFHRIFMDRIFATWNTRHARLFMIKLQLLQLLELACYSGLYVIRAPPCISIGHLLRRRSSSWKLLKMHRGLARALFSIKQNVAFLDATFYCAPCRYHVVDKLQSAFRSESTSSLLLSSFSSFFLKRISILIFIAPLTRCSNFSRFSKEIYDRRIDRSDDLIYS